MFHFKRFRLPFCRFGLPISLGAVVMLMASGCQHAFDSPSRSELPIEPSILDFPQHTDSSGNSIEAELVRITVPDEQYPSHPVHVGYVRFKGKGERTIFLLGDFEHPATTLASGSGSDLIRKLTQSGDVIAFDFRGSGVSTTSAPCPAAVKIPLSRPLAHQEYAHALRSWLDECAPYFKQKGFILNQYAFNRSVDDILRLLNLLDLSSVPIITYGKGAAVAQAFAMKHPGRTSALIFLNPGVEFLGPGLPKKATPCSELSSFLERDITPPKTIQLLTESSQNVELHIGQEELKLVVETMLHTGVSCTELKEMLLVNSELTWQTFAKQALEIRQKLGRPNPAAVAFSASFPTFRPSFEEAVTREVVHLPANEQPTFDFEKTLLIVGEETLESTTEDPPELANQLNIKEIQIVPDGGDVSYLIRKDVIESISEFIQND